MVLDNGIFETAEQLSFVAVDGNAITPTTNGLIPVGVNTIQTFTYTVPQDATYEGGETHARFRLSTTGDLLPTGLALDGEVEDYWFPVAKVGNYVWEDNDLFGNQNEDPTEYAINDFNVQLTYTDENGTPIVYETTTANLAGTDGKYFFCGLIEGTYEVSYNQYPQGMISAIPNNANDDNVDNDGNTFSFSIGEYANLLPTGEYGTGDTPGQLANHPDDQEQINIDFAFVDEPTILSSLALVDVAPAADCGHYYATYEMCVKNGEMALLENINAMLPLADNSQLGTTFIQVIEAPEYVSSTTGDAPVLNAAFDGMGNNNLFDGASGVLAEGEQVCLHVVIEIDPEADNAPTNPSLQASVDGGARRILATLEILEQQMTLQL